MDSDREVEKTAQKEKERKKLLALAPIAEPLAGKKLSKKTFKLVRRATEHKCLKRGVKEVVKSIRRGHKGLCVIAGNISPIDVITHVPIQCEEADIPYIYVSSEKKHQTLEKFEMEGSESEKVFDSLNLNPQLFINEALNCVNDLVDDAFDFFHQEATKLLKTEGTDRSEDLRKGVAITKNIIQLTLDKRMSMWEKYSLHHCFTVPQGFSLPKADGPSGDSSFDTNGIENLELDSTLDILRTKLSQVGKESVELNRELQALERQSMLSGRSTASLTEALELYQQQSVNEKFEELVRTASDFHTKLETLTTRMMEDTEHVRAKKIRISNGELYRLNNDEGLLCATMEELQELVDDIKTLRD